MNPRHRRYTRRRYRRRNPAMPAFIRGLLIPDLMQAGVAVGGAVGSKWIARQIPVLKDAKGMMAPLATFAAGIGASLLLAILRPTRPLAKSVALGATIMAGIDLLKQTPIGAQLGGDYYLPGVSTPMLGAGGMGNLPTGYINPADLGAGEETFFMAEDNLS